MFAAGRQRGGGGLGESLCAETELARRNLICDLHTPTVCMGEVELIEVGDDSIGNRGENRR